MFSLLQIQIDNFDLKQTDTNALYGGFDKDEEERLLVNTEAVMCDFFDERYGCLTCLDTDELCYRLTEGSPGFMKSASCIFLRYFGSTDIFKSFMDLQFNYMLRTMLKQPKEKSVIEVSDDDNKLFVIKSSEDTAMCINEAFVGICGTNSIRFIIPNFSYIFSYGKCPDDIEIDRSVVAWSNDVDRSCIVCEQVKGKSIESYINNYDKLINYFVQILYALAYAEKTLGFTHYDLHGNNIIIRELGKIKQLVYKDKDGSSVYLTTDAIATIIDYESSTIVYNGKHYGYTIESAGISPKTFALYDCYKLLYYILYDSYKGKHYTVFNKLKKLYSFFSTDTVEDVLISHETTTMYYAYLPYDEFKNITVYDFIEFVKSKLELYFLSTEKTKEEEYTIDTKIDRIEHYLIDPIRNIKDIFSYYDMYQYIINTPGIPREMLVTLYRNFTYDENEAYEQFSKIIDEFNLYSNVTIVKIDQCTFDTDTFDEYLIYVKKMIRYYFSYLKIKHYTHAFEEVSKMYGKRPLSLINIQNAIHQHTVALRDSLVVFDRHRLYCQSMGGTLGKRFVNLINRIDYFIDKSKIQ